MHQFTVHRTRTGMPIGVLRAPRFRRALVQLYVHAGSRFETVRSSGSTHLLEHVLFRGTRRYPTRQALEEGFQRFQVEANAYTEREWVSIHLAGPRAQALKAVEFAVEIGFKPRFRDVDVERSIVDAEIRESRMAEGLAHERIGRLLWGNHPLGFPVAGRRSPRTSRQGLRALHRRFFRPQNSFLLVAGNLDPGAVQRKVRRCLAGVEPGVRRLPPAPPRRRGPLLRLGPEKSRGLRVVFHLQAPRPLDERGRLHLWLVGRLLEVRLGRLLREDRGACYDLYVEDEFGHRLNAISVNAVVRRSLGPMLVAEIFDQFRRIREAAGERKDLEIVRSGMLRSYELMGDDLHDLADYYARQALLAPGRPPIRPAEARRAARKPDLETVAAAARGIVAPGGLSLVLLAPFTTRERAAWRTRFDRWIGTWR